MTTDSVLSSEQIRLLTEVGMVAAGRGFPQQAAAIFESLRVIRPDRSFPYIGLAVCRLNAGEPEEAARLLEKEGLAACPGDPDIRVFLGLALRLAKRQGESTRVLEAVLGEHPEASVAKLARALLAAPAVA